MQPGKYCKYNNFTYFSNIIKPKIIKPIIHKRLIFPFLSIFFQETNKGQDTKKGLEQYKKGFTSSSDASFSAP